MAAVADLDADARRDVDCDIEVGDSEVTIYKALLATRLPLRADLLCSIRAGIVSGWYGGAMRDQALDAIGR